MKILFATDFSDAARTAGRASARLAGKLGAELIVLHVAHLPGARPSMARGSFSLSPDELKRRTQLVDAQAAELRALCPRVETKIVEGLPDEGILEVGDAERAELIVLGPVGDRGAQQRALGTIAGRVIKASSVPVMIAREERSIDVWTHGGRPLRVMLGYDGSRPARAALDWLRDWRRAGEIELSAIHVHAGSEELAPGHVLRERVERVFDDAEVRVRTLPARGRPTVHLVDAANYERSDLLVVGTHRRGALDRLRHGSVSLDVAASAQCNVVTVPLTKRTAPRTAPREIRRVVVPVDLSELSHTAVAWALGTLPRDGELQLVHVLPPLRPIPGEAPGLVTSIATPEEVTQRLEELVPAEARSRGIVVRTNVIEAFDAARSIVDVAERTDADLICLTTHGRSGLARTVLGSVAEAVVRASPIPVVVVPVRER
jgi:nucleotide-binding universal stress UspA family protein